MNEVLVSGVSLASAVLLTVAAGSRAAAVITIDHKALEGAQPPSTYSISFDKDRARINTPFSYSGGFIYRGDKDVLWTLNDSEKTYDEMTRREMEDFTRSMDATAQWLVEQAAELSPEQRKEFQANLPEHMTALWARKPTYRKAAAGKTGPWNCRMHEALVDGVKTAEVCLADPGELGLSAADVQAFQDMGEKLVILVKELQPMLRAVNAPKAFPVRTVILEGGKPRTEILVREVKAGAVPANQFEVPAGYVNPRAAVEHR